VERSGISANLFCCRNLVFELTFKGMSEEKPVGEDWEFLKTFLIFLFRFYAFLLSLFYFRLQVDGVDNALIKGEIESQWTGLIALLV
jgi:hypothetical protein